MATLGNSTTPTFGFDAFNSTANQAGELYTVPAGGGTFTSVSFYGSGDGATTVKAYGCLWDSSGNLLAAGSGINTSGGSQTAGGQAWHTDTLTSPVSIAGGTQIFIGWWRQASTGTFDWSFAGDGSTAVHYHTDSLTAPGHTGTSVTVQNGSIGAYATYTPGGEAYINTGTSAAPVWTAGVVQVNTGTSAAPVWTVAEADVNTGTSVAPVWTPGG